MLYVCMSVCLSQRQELTLQNKISYVFFINPTTVKGSIYTAVYQSPLILTELFQHNLINVSYLTACYLYQVMMTLQFLNDVANDAKSAHK